MKQCVSILLIACPLYLPLLAQASGTRAISEAQMSAVIQAIQDEIYDYGYQGYFADLDHSLQGKGGRIAVYFQPNLEADGEGWAIYKLMPYGEVHRAFYFGKNGLAVLDGDPENGFPLTQPSNLTVYMDDDMVCRAKHLSLKRYFDIMFLPTSETVQAAAERQKQRVGFSAYESKALGSK